MIFHENAVLISPKNVLDTSFMNKTVNPSVPFRDSNMTISQYIEQASLESNISEYAQRQLNENKIKVHRENKSISNLTDNKSDGKNELHFYERSPYQTRENDLINAYSSEYMPKNLQQEAFH